MISFFFVPSKNDTLDEIQLLPKNINHENHFSYEKKRNCSSFFIFSSEDGEKALEWTNRKWIVKESCGPLIPTSGWNGWILLLRDIYQFFKDYRLKSRENPERFSSEISPKMNKYLFIYFFFCSILSFNISVKFSTFFCSFINFF